MNSQMYDPFKKKKRSKRDVFFVLLLGISFFVNGCWFYSFQGSTIPPSVQTVSIALFENKAQLVNPSLSNLLTEKLKEKFRKMTRLEFVEEDGDFDFEGEITQYDSATMGYTADEVGALNRLTITVKIYFRSTDKHFDQSFTKYADYPSDKSLDEMEAQLVAEIIEELIEDIFNATAADW